MDVQEAAEEYLAALRNRVKAKQMQPKTYALYEQRLGVFVRWCTTNKVTLEAVRNKSVEGFLGHLKEHHKPHKATQEMISDQTLQGYVRIILAFLNWCLEDEEYEQYVKAITVKRIKMPKAEEKVIDTFTVAHIDALFVASGKEYNEVLRERDRAIVTLLLDTGIRAEELCTLTLGNTSLDPRNSFVKVYGKGRKWREVPFGEKTRRQLRRYLRLCREDAQKKDVLFVNRAGRPMTVYGLDRLFRRLGEWAGVEGVRCSPHTCRHTFAREFWLRTHDLLTLSKYLGHASIAVTMEYLKSLTGEDIRLSNDYGSYMDSL